MKSRIRLKKIKQSLIKLDFYYDKITLVFCLESISQKLWFLNRPKECNTKEFIKDSKILFCLLKKLDKYWKECKLEKQSQGEIYDIVSSH